MASLGVGIACITSVGPRFALASEFVCLGQSLARRLITRRGSLSWAPNDGTDMRDFLNSAFTPRNRFAVQAAAKAECEKDERVQAATVDAQFSVGSLSLTIGIETASGPFKLVVALTSLGISDLKVTP